MICPRRVLFCSPKGNAIICNIDAKSGEEFSSHPSITPKRNYHIIALEKISETNEMKVVAESGIDFLYTYNVDICVDQTFEISPPTLIADADMSSAVKVPGIDYYFATYSDGKNELTIVDGKEEFKVMGEVCYDHIAWLSIPVKSQPYQRHKFIHVSDEKFINICHTEIINNNNKQTVVIIDNSIKIDYEPWSICSFPDDIVVIEPNGGRYLSVFDSKTLELRKISMPESFCDGLDTPGQSNIFTLPSFQQDIDDLSSAMEKLLELKNCHPFFFLTALINLVMQYLIY